MRLHFIVTLENSQAAEHFTNTIDFFHKTTLINIFNSIGVSLPQIEIPTITNELEEHKDLLLPGWVRAGWILPLPNFE